MFKTLLTLLRLKRAGFNLADILYVPDDIETSLDIEHDMEKILMKCINLFGVVLLRSSRIRNRNERQVVKDYVLSMFVVARQIRATKHEYEMDSNFIRRMDIRLDADVIKRFGYATELLTDIANDRHLDIPTDYRPTRTDMEKMSGLFAEMARLV